MVGVNADPLRHLVDAAAEGDDVALERLVRETQVAVWRVCTALGTPGEEADLVQETYLRAVRSLPTYRGDAPVIGWLRSIARRVCADDVRARQRRRRLHDRVAATTVDLRTPSDEGEGTAVRELLGQLDPDRREAFMLTQYAGLSYEEAAAVIGCPIGTVRSRVARARADLAGSVATAESA